MRGKGTESLSYRDREIVNSGKEGSDSDERAVLFAFKQAAKYLTSREKGVDERGNVVPRPTMRDWGVLFSFTVKKLRELFEIELKERQKKGWKVVYRSNEILDADTLAKKIKGLEEV